MKKKKKNLTQAGNEDFTLALASNAVQILSGMVPNVFKSDTEAK